MSDRAVDLARRWPAAAEPLRFHARVARLRDEAARALPPGPPERTIEALPAFVPGLLTLAAEAGPAPLARRARDLRDADWPARFHDALQDGLPPDPLDAFFVRVLLEPWFASRPAPESAGTGRCPRCGSLPVASVLRPDPAAETVRRTLLCSLCFHEWPFPRAVCPGCGEERPERQPRFSAEEIPWIRIEACDSCGRYLKSVDLAADPAADPRLDELASFALDIVARDRGYAKLAPNLFGT
jgi:FdhE protein